MSKPETTEVAVAAPVMSEIVALTPSVASPVAFMQLAKGLGDLGSLHKLDTIKCPTGGSTFWTLQGFDGNEINKKSFKGIIIAMFIGRKFWKLSYNERNKAENANMPPDCKSVDGVYGTAYGKCHECQFSKFDKATNRKPCAEERKLVIMPEHSLVPIVLRVSTMSIDPLGRYTMRLAGGGMDANGNFVPPKLPWSVITEFSLEKVTASVSKTDYARYKFTMVRTLTPAEEETVAALKNAIDTTLDFLNTSTVNSDEGE